MSYEMMGAIKVIMEPMTFPSGFTKRQFVVSTDDRYPQEVIFSCIKERCGLLDRIKVGDRVRVDFVIRGRLSKERYFVDLEAGTIERLEVDGSSVTVTGDEAAETEAVPVPNEATPDDDTMPF